MPLAIETDDFGRMICSVTDGSQSAVVTAAAFVKASSDLWDALDQLEARGLGECYWAESTGEYRWVFRRNGENVRLAVMWSIGTMTGWEDVFWAEWPANGFLAQVREELLKTRALA
jgi:hypothetical protein